MLGKLEKKKKFKINSILKENPYRKENKFLTGKSDHLENVKFIMLLWMHLYVSKS
jgi:hypothetical protein